jgi:enoyl-[acyl-carrier protein] reductase/trans-2-enoyl-CoA reductase (NAD+)
VADAWANISTENLSELTDFKGYKEEFLRLFGFEMEGVDYDAEVDPNVQINNLIA